MATAMIISNSGNGNNIIATVTAADGADADAVAEINGNSEPPGLSSQTDTLLVENSKNLLKVPGGEDEDDQNNNQSGEENFEDE